MIDLNHYWPSVVNSYSVLSGIDIQYMSTPISGTAASRVPSGITRFSHKCKATQIYTDFQRNICFN